MLLFVSLSNPNPFGIKYVGTRLSWLIPAYQRPCSVGPNYTKKYQFTQKTFLLLAPLNMGLQ